MQYATDVSELLNLALHHFYYHAEFEFGRSTSNGVGVSKGTPKIGAGWGLRAP